MQSNKRFFRGQFAIADLLLGLTVVAAWTAFIVSQKRVERLHADIQMLAKSAGELIIRDPTQYNAISQPVLRYYDEAWQIHLPEGRTYQLHLVTREIQADGFPLPSYHIPDIQPGLHRVELRQVREDKNAPRFTIAVDDEVSIDAKETADWNKVGGSSSTGIGKTQEVLPVEKPLVLKRLRAHVQEPSGSSHSPPDNEPATGILIWIAANEPVR